MKELKRDFTGSDPYCKYQTIEAIVAFAKERAMQRPNSQQAQIEKQIADARHHPIRSHAIDVMQRDARIIRNRRKWAKNNTDHDILRTPIGHEIQILRGEGVIPRDIFRATKRELERHTEKMEGKEVRNMGRNEILRASQNVLAQRRRDIQNTQAEIQQLTIQHAQGTIPTEEFLSRNGILKAQQTDLYRDRNSIRKEVRQYEQSRRR